MDMLKCCFNPKVLLGLGAVALGVLLFAPNLLASALPLLFVALCPLSMLIMMFGMRGMGGMAGQKAGQGEQTGVSGRYTCPMHPDVQRDQPGRCPICGMNLVAATPAQRSRVAQMDGTDAAPSQETELALLRAQLQSLNEQQAALARQVEHLEEAGAPAARSKALWEAEQVARSAESRQ